MTHPATKTKKIILFDGVCNLCNNSVNFIIDRDKNDIFRFASLQSEIGQQLTRERGIDMETMDSIILIEPGVAWYEKSTAALKISKELSGGYAYLTYLAVLPQGLRDGVYNLIAKNRYKWFGKEASCRIPTSQLKAKFLD